MKEISKEKQLEIIQKTYVTIDDVYNLLPIGKNYSSRLFREIEKELKDNGIPTFVTRPRVIPTEYLLKKVPSLRKLRKEIKK